MEGNVVKEVNQSNKQTKRNKVFRSPLNLLQEILKLLLSDPPIVQFPMLCLRDFCMTIAWWPLLTSFELDK
jgi:hypothetical protein